MSSWVTRVVEVKSVRLRRTGHGFFLYLSLHIVFMWIQHVDAKPQLIAPTYATVTRTGSITAPKRMETDAKFHKQNGTDSADVDSHLQNSNGTSNSSPNYMYLPGMRTETILKNHDSHGDSRKGSTVSKSPVIYLPYNHKLTSSDLQYFKHPVYIAEGRPTVPSYKQAEGSKSSSTMEFKHFMTGQPLDPFYYDTAMESNQTTKPHSPSSHKYGSESSDKTNANYYKIDASLSDYQTQQQNIGSQDSKNSVKITENRTSEDSNNQPRDMYKESLYYIPQSSDFELALNSNQDSQSNDPYDGPDSYNPPPLSKPYGTSNEQPELNFPHLGSYELYNKPYKSLEETHKPPSPADTHMPPSSMVTYELPAPMDTFKLPSHIDTYKSPSHMDAYKPPLSMHTNKYSTPADTYKPPPPPATSFMETYGPQSAADTNKSPSIGDTYKIPSHADTVMSSPTNTYKPPSPAESSSFNSDSDKPSVFKTYKPHTEVDILPLNKDSNKRPTNLYTTTKDTDILTPLDDKPKQNGWSEEEAPENDDYPEYDTHDHDTQSHYHDHIYDHNSHKHNFHHQLYDHDHHQLPSPLPPSKHNYHNSPSFLHTKEHPSLAETPFPPTDTVEAPSPPPKDTHGILNYDTHDQDTLNEYHKDIYDYDPYEHNSHHFHDDDHHKLPAPPHPTKHNYHHQPPSIHTEESPSADEEVPYTSKDVGASSLPLESTYGTPEYDTHNHDINSDYYDQHYDQDHYEHHTHHHLSDHGHNEPPASSPLIKYNYHHPPSPVHTEEITSPTKVPSPPNDMVKPLTSPPKDMVGAAPPPPKDMVKVSPPPPKDMVKASPPPQKDMVGGPLPPKNGITGDSPHPPKTTAKDPSSSPKGTYGTTETATHDHDTHSHYDDHGPYKHHSHHQLQDHDHHELSAPRPATKYNYHRPLSFLHTEGSPSPIEVPYPSKDNVGSSSPPTKYIYGTPESATHDHDTDNHYRDHIYDHGTYKHHSHHHFHDHDHHELSDSPPPTKHSHHLPQSTIHTQESPYSVEAPPPPKDIVGAHTPPTKDIYGNPEYDAHSHYHDGNYDHDPHEHDLHHHFYEHDHHELPVRPHLTKPKYHHPPPFVHTEEFSSQAEKPYPHKDTFGAPPLPPEDTYGLPEYDTHDHDTHSHYHGHIYDHDSYKHHSHHQFYDQDHHKQHAPPPIIKYNYHHPSSSIHIEELPSPSEALPPAPDMAGASQTPPNGTVSAPSPPLNDMVGTSPSPPNNMYGAPPPPPNVMYGASPPPPSVMYGIPPYSPNAMYGAPPPPPNSMYGAPPPAPNNTYGAPQNETQPMEKKPQITYYYLGRKLWILPLYAGICFIAYVLLLLLKAISRHKVISPYNYYTGVQSRHLKSHWQQHLYNTTEHVTKALKTAEYRYM
ncbi:uncharacterized protein LOC110841442 isoform X2 [Zootermopsis nevadensis]|uniref:uncharacterized protein LOC110841442 isoform X2 n=1 Tax=Zootermopsis nevadensis TaxID=136037 RepID=UPI000B8E552E|nr:uncharacterized protein LOC110841442 isoform X2 [Zootermopsis nevadensis]